MESGALERGEEEQLPPLVEGEEEEELPPLEETCAVAQDSFVPNVVQIVKTKECFGTPENAQIVKPKEEEEAAELGRKEIASTRSVSNSELPRETEAEVEEDVLQERALEEGDLPQLEEEEEEEEKGFCFQLLHVTHLEDGQLPSIPRDAGASVREGARPKRPHVCALVYGRTLEGRSVHLQMRMPPGFWLRLPFKWNIVMARKIGKALRAHSTSFHKRVNFVGFTPHVPTNNQLDEPQRVSYAYYTFETWKAADETFRSMRTKDGTRKYTPYLKNLLQRAGIKPAVLYTEPPEIFSAHDLQTAVTNFFDRLNEVLGLKKPNLVSFESWLTLSPDVKWLPPDRYFANSDLNAVIRLTDIVSAENRLESAPQSIVSYDIEEFSAIDEATGIRGFPQFGKPSDYIAQVALSHRMGSLGEIKTTVLCVQDTAFREPRDDVTKSMEVQVCGTEADLLLAFAAYLEKMQVDILTGFVSPSLTTTYSLTSKFLLLVPLLTLLFLFLTPQIQYSGL